MAFTANTAFEDRITNGRFNDLENVAGKFGTVAGTTLTPADCSAGWLVKQSFLLPCEGFSGVDNENTWAMVAATSSEDANTQIFACNTHDVQLISDGAGNNYAVGHRTLGLGVPSGRVGNFTHIIFDGMHTYRFGVGNLTTTLSTNKFLTISSGQLAPAASAPDDNGALYFKVMGTGNFTEGTQASFGYVDALACTAVADKT